MTHPEQADASITYETMDEAVFTTDQIQAAQTIKALLMFMDGGHLRIPDEGDHNKVIAYVFNNMDRYHLVRSIIQRDITNYEEVLVAVAEADRHHTAVRDGIL